MLHSTRRQIVFISFVADGSGKKQPPTKSAAEDKPNLRLIYICVGKITKARKHADADWLCVEDILSVPFHSLHQQEFARIQPSFKVGQYSRQTA